MKRATGIGKLLVDRVNDSIRQVKAQTKRLTLAQINRRLTPPKGFDYAPVKREGYSFNTETGESHPTTEKELCDARNNQSSWWMELRLEKGWTRERVHQEVERWLKGCGWKTRPTKNWTPSSI